MKVYWSCPTCKEENSKNTFHTDRVEFAMREGEIQKVKCVRCNKYAEIPVDDFYAQKSNLIALIAGGIALLGTPFIFYYSMYIASENYYIIGGYMLTPIVIYSIMMQQENTRVTRFNFHKFKR
tara:strand:+ start:2362 stop:2730 length:369 start_codon:yes stop_codon:yes gene_type:complete